MGWSSSSRIGRGHWIWSGTPPLFTIKPSELIVEELQERERESVCVCVQQNM